MKHLVKLAPETVDAVDSTAALPVHAAAYNDHRSIVKFLRTISPDNVTKAPYADYQFYVMGDCWKDSCTHFAFSVDAKTGQVAGKGARARNYL